MNQTVKRRNDETQQIQMGVSIRKLEILMCAHPHSERHPADQEYQSAADKGHINSHLPLVLSDQPNRPISPTALLPNPRSRNGWLPYPQYGRSPGSGKPCVKRAARLLQSKLTHYR
jgi:hypothetical protein